MAQTVAVGSTGHVEASDVVLDEPQDSSGQLLVASADHVDDDVQAAGSMELLAGPLESVA